MNHTTKNTNSPLTKWRIITYQKAGVHDPHAAHPAGMGMARLEPHHHVVRLGVLRRDSGSLGARTLVPRSFKMATTKPVMN